MIRFFYKRIIRKLNLSPEQLRTLQNRLVPEAICNGPFFKEGKMCPSTTALSLKLEQARLDDKTEILKQFRSFGISRFDLNLLYLVFDLPAIISDRFFRYSLQEMKLAIDEMLK